MSKPTIESNPDVLAVLHRTGGVWSGLVARIPGRSMGNGDGAGGGHHTERPAVLATRVFAPVGTGDGVKADVDAWLDEYRPEEVICVLPGSSVICRTCPLPDASLDQLLPALRLQAEAHLLGIAPPHRLGMAVLDRHVGETSGGGRTGLVLGWPEGSGTTPVAPPTARPVTYSPDIASLAAIVDASDSTDDAASAKDVAARVLVWLDRDSGSISIVLPSAPDTSGSSRLVFRALREDAEDIEQWKQAVVRVLAETALNAGWSATDVERLTQNVRQRLVNERFDHALLAHDAMLAGAASRIQFAEQDGAWWSKFGIAAGAVAARIGSLAALTRMHANPPLENPTPLRRALAAMSDPATARTLVIAAVLLFLFGPLVMSGLRLGVLKLRHSGVEQQLAAVREVDRLKVVYRELEKNAWPMTKVLADIACNTPEGIELDTIRVNQMRVFTVEGRALPHGGHTAQELVALMQRQLYDSNIFDTVSLNWGDADSFGHYQFRLNAKVHRPYHQFKYPVEQDFGQWTVVHRRDGRAPGEQLPATSDARMASAAPAQPAAPAPREPDRLAAGNEYDDTPPPDRARADASPRGSNGGQTTRESPRTTRRSDPTSAPAYDPDISRIGDPGRVGLPRSEDIPEQMTESQIAALTVAEVRETLTKVASARSVARARGDKELEERLEREFQWLMNRMRGGS